MKPMYQTLIVDDERLARLELIRILKNHSEIEIVDEASSVMEAKEKIERHQPDLIFLDVQLRKESGFDLLNQVDFAGKVIFVTAWDKYAVRAFEINALDYLMKPVSPFRLQQALVRLQNDIPEKAGLKINKVLRESSEGEVQLRKLHPEDMVFIHFGRQLRFQRVEEILLLRAQGPYSDLITISGQTGLVNKSLKEWEHQLPENLFLRIHRNAIINLSQASEVCPWSNYAYRITLKGLEEPIVVSRRFAKRLRERLG